MPEVRKLAIIIFADIVGYSAMMQADEKQALLTLDRFKQGLEKEMLLHQGTIVQYFGDGCLLSFDSAFHAISAAKTLQETFIQQQIPVRMGMHLGDVLFKNNNAFGDGVNIASRVESLGVPGSVLLSKTIRDQVKNKVEFSLTSLGSFHFKNIAEPMEVYAISNPGFKVPRPEEMKGKLKAGESSGTGQKANGKSSGIRPRTLILTLSSLVAVILLVFFFNRKSDVTHQSEGETTQQKQAIAVLPFSNLSPNEENGQFTAGMHEDVLNKLAGLQELRVMSRTAVLKFKDYEGSLDLIGEQLDVQYVVEGTVSRWEDRIKVTVKLVDVATDESLWSNSYDRKLENVFVLQGEIAQNIVGSLQTNISQQGLTSLAEVPTTVIEAYDSYTNARSILNSSWYNYDQLIEAIGFLQKAVEYDPGFVAGWSLLSQAQSERYGRLNEIEDTEEVAEALQAAEFALQQIEALQAGGFYYHRANGYYQDIVQEAPIKALSSLNKALEIVPNDAQTRAYLSRSYFFLGQLEEAVENMEKAYAVDNQNGMIIYLLTFGYEMTHRYADIVPFMERLLLLEPEKTHYAVQAKYFQFLADGKLESFRDYEEAVNTVEATEKYDSRSVLNNEMVIAMFNNDYQTYSDAWKGKWDQHHINHGNWSCPMIVNDEANQAHLTQQHGDPNLAHEIIVRAKQSATRPYSKNAFCIFNKISYSPKLEFMSGDTALAAQQFQAAIPEIMNNNLFPRGPVERMVLLETADLVAPDQVYSIYKQVTAKVVSFTSLEKVCSNPWIYPNLIKDPQFIQEVRSDGRFVNFLTHFGLISAGT